jgi:hypothetical protein
MKYKVVLWQEEKKIFKPTLERIAMAQIQVRHLRSQILAMSVATMLALYTIGVTIPALAPVSAYATNYDNKNDKHYDNKNDKHYDNKNDKHYDNKNDKHYDNKNDKHYDNKNDKHYDDTNNYKSSFLSYVEQCFPNSGNYGELFSDDVQECIYDVMAAYFNNDNYNDNNNDSSGSTTSGGNDESNTNDDESNTNDDESNTNDDESILSSQT